MIVSGCMPALPSYVSNKELKEDVMPKNGLHAIDLGNAIKYDGYFKNGLYDGNGTIYLEDGTTIKGHFKEGNLTKAEIFYANGSYYNGSFSNNLPDGEGYLGFPNGDYFLGNFESGSAFDGQLYNSKDKTTLFGEFNKELKIKDIGYLVKQNGEIEITKYDANNNNVFEEYIDKKAIQETNKIINSILVNYEDSIKQAKQEKSNLDIVKSNISKTTGRKLFDDFSHYNLVEAVIEIICAETYPKNASIGFWVKGYYYDEFIDWYCPDCDKNEVNDLMNDSFINPKNPNKKAHSYSYIFLYNSKFVGGTGVMSHENNDCLEEFEGVTHIYDHMFKKIAFHHIGKDYRNFSEGDYNKLLKKIMPLVNLLNNTKFNNLKELSDNISKKVSDAEKVLEIKKTEMANSFEEIKTKQKDKLLKQYENDIEQIKRKSQEQKTHCKTDCAICGCYCPEETNTTSNGKKIYRVCKM